jgi:hypothetical protein
MANGTAPITQCYHPELARLVPEMVGAFPVL